MSYPRRFAKASSSTESTHVDGSRLNKRISKLSSRVASLLSNNFDHRIQRSSTSTTTSTTSTTSTTPTTMSQQTQRPRRDHQIAREIQQIRNDVRQMSERADQRRHQLHSLLFRGTSSRRQQQQQQQQQQNQNLHNVQQQQQQQQRNRQQMDETVNLHNDTHINLTNTLPNQTVQRTEMRAWLADILDSSKTEQKGLTSDQLSTLASRQLLSSLDMSCCICLEGMNIGSIVTNLPCTHMFHTSCIRKWLHRSKCCPLCKMKCN
jgi:hypothetical protein